MQQRDNHQNRLKWLLIAATWATFALSSRIFTSILAQYANYFPPNFDAEFLFGRQTYFFGSYCLAFYAHIIASPIAMILGGWLMWTGRQHGKKLCHRKSIRKWHRRLGKTQGTIVIAIVVPTGLVMSTRAMNGPLAGLGFSALSMALMGSMLATIAHAKKRSFARHELWATRSFILLCSPLVLRLMTGATIITQTQSPLTYQMSA